MAKRRVDTLLVERGLAESREKARAAILSGGVLVGESLVAKPGTLIDEAVELRLLARAPYVGRGGEKLAHALSAFAVEVQGRTAVDVGASTGGFTDCLLQAGARRVYAVDVGYGQLDYRLRQDPRVVVMERVNARYPITIPEKVDLATVDVSFISATKILPSVSRIVREGGWIIVLLKPQFEAGRREVGKKGVVRDPQVHAAVLARFIAWVLAHPLRLRGLTPSPLLGAEGNREFFFLLANSP